MTKHLKALIVVVFIMAFIIISSGFFSIVVVAAGGLYTPSTYLNVWETNNYLSFRDDRLKLIAHAILAPNAYNLQPWEVELDKTNTAEFSVFVNTQRLAPLGDPKGREALISIGTFLEFLNIAGNQLGIIPTIQLFPNGELDEQNLLSSFQNLPIVKVTIQNQTCNISDLYPYIFTPSTNRSRYYNELLTDTQISLLKSVNNQENLELEYYNSPTDIDTIKQLILQATDIEVNDPATISAYKQNFRANEYEKNVKPYGLYFGNQDGGKVIRSFKQGAITLFPSLYTSSLVKSGITDQVTKAVDSMYNVGMIKTDANTRAEQVLAGRLYARMLLKAHTLGLSVYPLSRTVQDYEKVSDIVAQQHALYATENQRIQMLFKIGRATEKPVYSMRLGASQVLKPE